MNEVSKEVAVIDVPELKAVDQSKAALIAQAFSPMSAKLAEFEDGYNSIVAESSESITEDTVKKARRLRIDIGKIRIETGKIKDKQKENIKLEDKAIMGVHNFLVLAVKEKEDKLSEIERHFEKIQEEKRKALQKEREELIAPYVEDVAGYDLAGMQPEVWEAFLFSSKLKYEARIEAERKAEAERIENERLDNLERARRDIILPYREFWAYDNYNLREMSESDFNTICEGLKLLKSDYDTEQKRIREENARLQKEKEEAEKKAAAERAKVEAEKKAAEEKARKEREALEATVKKEREESERKLAVERAEKARIEKELQDKKNAEEAAAKVKAEAEKKAARAPDKDKIASFIEKLEMMIMPSMKTEEGKKLAQYADNKITELVSILKQQNDRM